MVAEHVTRCDGDSLRNPRWLKLAIHKIADEDMICTVCLDAAHSFAQAGPQIFTPPETTAHDATQTRLQSKGVDIFEGTLFG